MLVSNIVNAWRNFLRLKKKYSVFEILNYILCHVPNLSNYFSESQFYKKEEKKFYNPNFCRFL